MTATNNTKKAAFRFVYIREIRGPQPTAGKTKVTDNRPFLEFDGVAVEDEVRKRFCHFTATNNTNLHE